jgi:glycosyltransferase involved in cell wall biosynthesis
MTPQISIIVPVYKVEKYLRKCIDSILKQTYADWELLLIDDGSPDRSGEISDEYAVKDSRIRVFHKPNGGVSSARNLGLDEAQGEYVMFVDSDDWLTPDTLEKCAKYMDKYDVIRFGIRFVDSEDGSQYRIYNVDEDENLQDYTLKVVGRNAMLGVCVGAYKREILETAKIRFSKELISGEDWLVQFQILLKSTNVAFFNSPCYCYNKYNETSCTHGFRYITHLSNVQALSQIINLALDKYSYKELLSRIAYSKCDLIYDFFASKLVKGYGLSYDEIDKYKYVSNLKYREIFKGSTSAKQLVLLIIYKSFIGRILLRK